MNAARSSETLLNIYRPTWRHIPKYFESPSVIAVRPSYVACRDVIRFRNFVILYFIAKVTLCAGHKHNVAHPLSTEIQIFFFLTEAERKKILTNSYNDTNEIRQPNSAYVCYELLQ